LPAVTPADTHEWFSFQEPGFERTYMVDITFLRSNWTCIYGQGCQGVLTGPAAEMEQGCCSYGAHFVDGDDVATVEAVVGRLTPDQWQFAKQGRTPRKDGSPGWLKTDKHGTQTTRLVDDACIFLNRPGFAGRRRVCAARRCGRRRRVLHQLEARRVLATPTAPGGEHRR
jgi:hypothetical protein